MLWDLERAEKLALFQHRESSVASLAFTGERSHFAAADQDGSAALFDVRAPPTPAAGFESQDATLSVAVASCSNLLVTAGGDRSIRLWRTDPQPRAQLARLRRGAERARYLSRWAHRRERQRRRLGAPVVDLVVPPAAHLKAHQGQVTALAFSPNDRLLASAGEDGQVKAVGSAVGPHSACIQRSQRPSAVGGLLRRRSPACIGGTGRHDPDVEPSVRSSRVLRTSPAPLLSHITRRQDDADGIGIGLGRIATDPQPPAEVRAAVGGKVCDHITALEGDPEAIN